MVHSTWLTKLMGPECTAQVGPRAPPSSATRRSHGPWRLQCRPREWYPGRKEPNQEAEEIGRVTAITLRAERAMTLKGKYALVTGASRGIGRGIALKLAENGARVAIHYYVNQAAAKETLEGVRKHGSDGFLVRADVSLVEDVRRMFGDVRQAF